MVRDRPDDSIGCVQFHLGVSALTDWSHQKTRGKNLMTGFRPSYFLETPRLCSFGFRVSSDSVEFTPEIIFTEELIDAIAVRLPCKKGQ